MKEGREKGRDEKGKTRGEREKGLRRGEKMGRRLREKGKRR